MSLTIRISLCLVLGLLAGTLLAAHGGPAVPAIVRIAQPLGSAWLNGLRMTLVPLVFALLVLGVTSAAGTVQAGHVAGRAIILFAVGLLGAAVVSALATFAILSWWPVPHGAAMALSVGDARAPIKVESPSIDWLLGFIPVNPIRSAANDEMVPLVLFALIFGFAATRIAEDRRTLQTGFFQALVDTLLVIIGWVLRLAPFGVFALALVAGARAGLSAAGALLHYVAVIVAVCLLVTLLVYPLAMIFGRVSPGRFARAVLPAQAIAFSTQSSIASLPAMIAATTEQIGVPVHVRAVVLPMAVSLFRITSPAANLAVALYIAHLYGMALAPGQVAIGVVVAAVVSLAAVGLPSQATFFTTIGPICLAMGLPVDALPLLLAVETVPDIFRTVGNVTADIAVTRIAWMGRGMREGQDMG